MPILEFQNVSKVYNNTAKALDNVSFSIDEGEFVSIIGPSGAGKSTVLRCINRLIDATSGNIIYDGQNVMKLKKRELRQVRTKTGMIFQHYNLVNRLSVIENVLHGKLGQKSTVCGVIGAYSEQEKERAFSILDELGLADQAYKRCDELSGGQKQRVGIARALAVNPDFIVCDEPISALDVSIQAQVINLLEQLQRERGLTYLFIAHDLSMVKHISDRIGVMYLGSLVELADSEELFENPMHPYTKALLSAIPIPDPDIEKNRQRIMLEGTLPNPIDLGEECKFCSRCPVCKDSCHKSQPKLVEVKPGHFVACSQCAE